MRKLKAKDLEVGMLVRGNITNAPEIELWEVCDMGGNVGLYLNPWFSCAAKPLLSSESTQKAEFTELEMPKTPRELITFIREFQNNYDERINA